MKKSAQRDANTAHCLCSRGPSSISTEFEVDSSIRSKVIRGSQNFEIGAHDPGHAHLGVVLYSICKRGLSSISVPNLKRIAHFVQKLLRRPEIRKSGHVTRPTDCIMGPP